MEKDLLKLALQVMCFGIFAALNLAELNVYVRCILFIGAFFCGWGMCYTVGRIANVYKLVDSNEPEN